MGGGDGRRNAKGRLNHGGRWRHERAWPLARTEYTKYYLRARGGFSIEPPGTDDPPVSYTHDPEHPVPTISAPIGVLELLPLPEKLATNTGDPRDYVGTIFPDGGAHQEETPGLVGAGPPYPLLADRADVLVFQTEPLAADVELTGAIEVNLWVSSSAVDTDFTAKLLDVYPQSNDYPDGYHLNLVDSIIRARCRNGFRARRDDGTSHGLQSPSVATADQQPVQGGPPDQTGYCEQQLPQVRREPKYRGAGGEAYSNGEGA